MKHAINYNDLKIDQLKALNYSEVKWQNAIQMYIAKINTNESKNAPECSNNKSVNPPFKFKKTKLYIKNMVSIRCIMFVKAELDLLGLNYGKVELGEVELRDNISAEQSELFKIALMKTGLELMDDHKAILVEKIKNVVIEMIHYADELPKIKISEYISEKLDHNYTYLANLFSEVTGTNIEHYIIVHKIEHAKELITYGELTLSEIAYKLHYSSIAHLSNQFKMITGLTPSFFKSLKHKKRTLLEIL